jgi:pilus assembly protein CpaF
VIPAELYAKSIASFFAPIRCYFEDPSVSEILINGPGTIFVERSGTLARVEARFESEEALLSALRNVAQYVGRPFDVEHPILEGRLPDGSRIEALLPPVSPAGPAVAIRRFSPDTLTIDELLALGSLSDDAARTLAALIAAKQNIVISGGTGSGKTSLLNCLSSFIPEGERVVVIEDARELSLQQPHVLAFEARPADARGKGAVTIRDLFRASLRMRPDRIVVGEIRGAEALELIQAMTSGHDGCLSTVHASHPRDALARLETLALMSDVALPLEALRAQIASAVDVVIQTSRAPGGRRRITHVTEIIAIDGQRGGYQLEDLFALRADARGQYGPLAPTGALPDCLDAIRRHGHDLPPAVYLAAQRRAP